MQSGLKQVKIGAFLTYALLFINTIVNFWMTPFLVKNLGMDEYGLFKLVGSLSGSLLVLNLGIGDTVQRYVSLYVAQGNNQKIPNLMAMCLRISLLLNGLIFFVGIIVILLFPTTYGNTLLPEQLGKGTIMLVILVANIMLTVIENLFSGLLAGYNQFVFTNSLKIIIFIFRTLVIFLGIRGGGNSVFLVALSFGLTLLTLIIEWFYSRKKLHLRIKYEGWDKSLFQEAGKFTVLMFLTALAGQAFTNVDNIVIGAFLGTAVVTIYSVAQFFFNLFQQLSCAISGVMLPTVTMVLQKENGLKKAEQLVIQAGRVQFILLGAALAGIISIGKEFIFLWLGDGYERVHLLILILVGPTLFELCTNVCNSILAASNKIAFRTYVNFISAAINAILTIILVKTWSYIGAAVATAFSYISCSLITMNIYYIKVMKLDMISIHKGIIGNLWICMILPMGVLFILNNYLYGSWVTFIMKVIIFVVIYVVFLLIFGLHEEEKRQIPIIGKFFRREGYDSGTV